MFLSLYRSREEKKKYLWEKCVVIGRVISTLNGVRNAINTAVLQKKIFFLLSMLRNKKKSIGSILMSTIAMHYETLLTWLWVCCEFVTPEDFFSFQLKNFFKRKKVIFFGKNRNFYTLHEGSGLSAFKGNNCR